MAACYLLTSQSSATGKLLSFQFFTLKRRLIIFKLWFLNLCFLVLIKYEEALFVSAYIVNLKMVNPWYPRSVTIILAVLPLWVYPITLRLPLHRIQNFVVFLCHDWTRHVWIQSLSRRIYVDWGFITYAYVCLMVLVEPFFFLEDFVGLWRCKTLILLLCHDNWFELCRWFTRSGIFTRLV